MKGILTISILLFSILSIAQTTSKDKVEVDERLFEVYDKEYLTDLQTKNPNLLQRWSFSLDHSFYITEYPKEKGTPNFPIVEISDIENVNILLLEKNQRIGKDFKKRMKYKIQGTDKILVYYSGEEFNQKLNEYLGRN